MRQTDAVDLIPVEIDLESLELLIDEAVFADTFFQLTILKYRKNVSIVIWPPVTL